MFGNNFYNPYMYQPYYQTASTARNLGSLFNTSAGSNIGKATGITSIFKNFSLNGFLNGASKTLNIVNQAIPVYYQVKPIFNNAKTMFRIMSAVKDDDNSIKEIKPKPINKSIDNKITKQNYDNYQTENLSDNPIFFI